jgi:excisionase family DNA binding protein
MWSARVEGRCFKKVNAGVSSSILMNGEKQMKLLDVRGAAEVLAISPWTVRGLIRDGKLRPVRVGRLVRLEAEELAKFVSQAKVQIEVGAAAKNQGENEAATASSDSRDKLKSPYES